MSSHSGQEVDEVRQNKEVVSREVAKILSERMVHLGLISISCEAQNQLFALGFGNYRDGQLPKEEFEERGHSGDVLLQL